MAQDDLGRDYAYVRGGYTVRQLRAMGYDDRHLRDLGYDPNDPNSKSTLSDATLNAPRNVAREQQQNDPIFDLAKRDPNSVGAGTFDAGKTTFGSGQDRFGQTFGQEQGLAQNILDAANGKGPSAAQDMFQSTLDQSLKSAQALGQSQAGVSPGASLRSILEAQGNMAGEATSKAAALRANEINNARSAASNLLSGMSGQASNQSNLGLNQQQLGAGMSDADRQAQLDAERQRLGGPSPGGQGHAHGGLVRAEDVLRYAWGGTVPDAVHGKPGTSFDEITRGVGALTSAIAPIMMYSLLNKKTAKERAEEAAAEAAAKNTASSKADTSIPSATADSNSPDEWESAAADTTPDVAAQPMARGGKVNPNDLARGVRLGKSMAQHILAHGMAEGGPVDPDSPADAPPAPSAPDQTGKKAVKSGVGAVGGAASGALAGAALSGPLAPVGAIVGGLAGLLGGLFGANGGEVDEGRLKTDDERRDRVPAMLSEGEIVLPRSVAMDPDAPDLAKQFVAAIKKRKYSRGGPVNAKGYGRVLEVQRELKQRIAALDKKLAALEK